MVIKLVLPFVAAEFILEMTMGVLMKLIPQIHVFVINIQCKILLGIMLMMLFAYPMGAFMDRYTEAMMTEAQKLLMMFGVTGSGHARLMLNDRAGLKQYMGRGSGDRWLLRKRLESHAKRQAGRAQKGKCVPEQ